MEKKAMAKSTSTSSNAMGEQRHASEHGETKQKTLTAAAAADVTGAVSLCPTPAGYHAKANQHTPPPPNLKPKE